MPEARVSSTTPTTVMGGFVLNLRPIGLATPGHRRFAAVALTMTTRGSPRSLAVNTRPDLRRIPSVPKYSGVMARVRESTQRSGRSSVASPHPSLSPVSGRVLTAAEEITPGQGGAVGGELIDECGAAAVIILRVRQGKPHRQDTFRMKAERGARHRDEAIRQQAGGYYQDQRERELGNDQRRPQAGPRAGGATASRF